MPNTSNEENNYHTMTKLLTKIAPNNLHVDSEEQSHLFYTSRAHSTPKIEANISHKPQQRTLSKTSPKFTLSAKIVFLTKIIKTQNI